MEVVELYTFGVLGKVSNVVGLAISWVEKAALPEERRQGLLRRLYSLLSLKTVNVPEASSFEEDFKDSSYALVNNKKSLANEKNDEIDYVLKLSKQHEPSSLWSSHPLSLKLGNTQFNVSKQKVAISLVGLIIYMLRFEEKTSCFHTYHSQTNGVHKKSHCRFLKACVFIPSESSCSYSIHTKHHNMSCTIRIV